MKWQTKAEPRWGWSGSARLTVVQLSVANIDLPSLLPGHRSSDAVIMRTLCDLGARYQRYLHQDEFGPTCAQRMAALRSLLGRFDLLISRLKGLPEHLRLRLCDRLAFHTTSAEPDVDSYQAYRSDVTAARQIAEAAVEVERIVPGEAALMAGLSVAAQEAASLLNALDTTTASAIAIDSDCPALEIGADVDIDLIAVATVSARVERLRQRAELVLAGMDQRHGPERCESLRWLVWQLCDLYHLQTGRRVTNSAVNALHSNASGTHYTAKPESPAGRFVLAVVQALQPCEAWAREPDHWVAQRRVAVLDNSRLQRAVHFAMRRYVADHYHSARRPGANRSSNFVNRVGFQRADDRGHEASH